MKATGIGIVEVILRVHGHLHQKDLRARLFPCPVVDPRTRLMDPRFGRFRHLHASVSRSHHSTAVLALLGHLPPGPLPPPHLHRHPPRCHHSLPVTHL